LRQLRAVKDDHTDGIGMSINAHPGIVAIRGTSTCRGVSGQRPSSP
jgi:hypothetical protein